MARKARFWILISSLATVALAAVLAHFLVSRNGVPVFSPLGTSRPGQEVRIGVVLPLTGELGNFGKTVLNGITLAVEEYSAVRPTLLVRLFSEDSQGKPALAVAAFQKLVDIDGARVIIGELTSSSTLAMNPIAQQRKVLLVSPTASNPKLSQAGKYFLRVWPSDSFDGMIAAEYCYRQLGLRSAAVICVNNDYGIGLKDVFVTRFNELGGRVIFTDSYLEQTTDFRTLLTKLRELKPAVLYIPGHPRGIATILRQAKELGIKMTFFANVAAEDKEFLTLSAGVAGGLLFTAPAFDIASREANVVEFVRRYKARFSDLPDVHAVKGYDAVSVVLRGIRVGKMSPDDLREFAGSQSAFHGVGGTFRFGRNGDVVTALSVKQYSGAGSVHILENVSPASGQ